MQEVQTEVRHSSVRVELMFHVLREGATYQSQAVDGKSRESVSGLSAELTDPGPVKPLEDRGPHGGGGRLPWRSTFFARCTLEKRTPMCGCSS
jgi:hypothetical protein